eukprot:9832-Lingulodinium_polyedra.AAC.1
MPLYGSPETFCRSEPALRVGEEPQQTPDSALHKLGAPQHAVIQPTAVPDRAVHFPTGAKERE